MTNTLNLSPAVPRKYSVFKGSTETIKGNLSKIIEHLETIGKAKANVHVLMFDDVSSDTAQVITKQILGCLKGHVKVIMTTNNSTLYPQFGVKVEGFTQKETLAFFREGFECTENDNAILELGERFSYLPLGLAVAKQFIRKRHQTIAGYLKQLTSHATSMKCQQREAKMFIEGEYDKGLISALRLSIEDVKASVSDDIFQAYEMTSFLSHIRFPLDHLKMFLRGSDEENDVDVDDLIEVITETSIGSINIDHYNMRMLSTHKAVQMALQIGWSPNEAQEKLGECLVFLSQICNKDTRFESAFQLQLTLLPHAEKALSHTVEFSANTLNIQTAEIRLLESLGHMYSQITLLLKSEHYMLRAREKFFDYFFTPHLKEQTLKGLHAPKTDEIQLRFLADRIIDKLFHASQEYPANEFVDLVLMRMHSQQDVDMWACKVRQRSSRGSLKVKNQRLNEVQYGKLLSTGAALPPSTIQNILLPELLITILYTYGRIYCFMHSKEEVVTPEKEAYFLSSLTLSYEMCKAIKLRYNVSLIHLLLTKHYGLLYHLMDEHNKTDDEIVRDVSKAEESYAQIIKDRKIYFQSGLLKKDSQEQFNMVVSLRQQLKCFTKLIKYTKDSYVRDDLVERAKEVRKKLVESYDDVSGCVLILHRASFYNINADFSVLLYQLGKYEEINNAIELYLASVTFEKSSCLVRYPWLLALIGLTNACLIKKSNRDINIAEQKVEEFLHQLIGKNSVYPHEWNVATTLMTKLRYCKISIAIDQLSPGHLKHNAKTITK